MNLGTRLKLLLVRWADRWNRLILGAARRLMFRRLRPERDLPNIKRVLVFDIGNIGDFLADVPALEAVRQRLPRAHITLLTSPGRRGIPGAADLLSPGWLVDGMVVYFHREIWGMSRLWGLVRDLRSRRFDLFVSIPGELTTLRRELRSLLLARLVGCRYAIGSSVSFHRWFKREQMLHTPQVPVYERIYGTVSSELGIERPLPPLHLPLPETAREEAASLLSKVGLQPGQPFVAVHPGGKTSARRWFEERFAHVADLVISEFGVPVVLLGSANEVEMVRRVAAQMKHPALDLSGQTSVLGLAALLERARLVLCNNSGSMHLAAAVGTPVVAVFSARDFAHRWEPPGERHRFLRHDVPCSPCYLEECPRGLLCLQPITADMVFEAVKQAMQGRMAERLSARRPGDLP